MRWNLVRTILATALVGSLAACNSGGEQSTEPTNEARSVTVQHIAGSTTVEGTPQRIVALGQQWVDALAEFDVAPIGYISAGNQGNDRGLFPWQSLPEESVMLDSSTGTAADRTPPVEQIATLNPDLILVSGIASPEPFASLRELAPTVFPQDTTVDNWQWQVDTLGRILGREDDARAILDKGNSFTAGILQQYPRLAGKTAVLSQYVVSTQQLVAVVDPRDGAARVFDSIGLSVPSDLAASPDARNGRVVYSPERIDALTADLVVLLPNGSSETDLRALPGLGSLPATVGGGLAVADYATVAGFNFPSRASIEYSIDRIRPQLDAVGR